MVIDLHKMKKMIYEDGLANLHSRVGIYDTQFRLSENVIIFIFVLNKTVPRSSVGWKVH